MNDYAAGYFDLIYKKLSPVLKTGTVKAAGAAKPGVEGR